MLRLVSFFLIAGPTMLAAQYTGSALYTGRYQELQSLAPTTGQVADVSHLVLGRDVGQLTLEQGKIYFLSPVGGRVVGAVFRGKGTFTLAPSLPTEQAELQRFSGTEALNDSISEAILLFADSTMQQLRGLPTTPGEATADVGDHVRDLIGSFRGRNEGDYASDVIGPLLNGDTSGFFLARLERAHGGPLLFEYDPSASESVQLYRPVSRLRWGTNWAVVTQFAPLQPLAGSSAWWFRKRLTVPFYRMDVRLTSTGAADLDFAASASVTVRADESVGPWLLFHLHPKLVVDSGRWASGDLAETFKAKESSNLWVRSPRQLRTGDSLSLILYYHGDLIDRLANWFFIDPSADWYPVNGQGVNNAMFDITIHSPNWYPIAGVGERVDSSATGKVMTTHWVTRLPTPYATFNLGLFDNYHVQQPGAPPLDVLLSEEAHRELRRQLSLRGITISEQSHMKENVAADVSNSLKLYTHLFGECSYPHFYVTEIPYDEGVSFPGMIDLSWSTFQLTSLDGFDEWF